MAVKFFRMSEKGSIKRPTLAAIGFIVACWAVTIFFLREHPFMFIFIAAPIEYALGAIIFANPFRITLGKLMHFTREPVITALPTKADRMWLEANEPIFEKTGLKMYRGESISTTSELAREVSRLSGLDN